MGWYWRIMTGCINENGRNWNIGGGYITDVETEQVYITEQEIERKSKEIERKKKPKRRPSLADATRNFSRSLSFSNRRSVGSVGNNDQGNLMTRSCRSLSMGLGVSNVDSTFHSVSLDRTSHSVSFDAPRTWSSISLHKQEDGQSWISGTCSDVRWGWYFQWIIQYKR